MHAGVREKFRGERNSGVLLKLALQRTSCRITLAYWRCSSVRAFCLNIFFLALCSIASSAPAPVPPCFAKTLISSQGAHTCTSLFSEHIGVQLTSCNGSQPGLAH
eukprot:61763-Pelagomonas_calceolata.AAC.1